MVRNDSKSHSVKLVTEVTEPEVPKVEDERKGVGRTILELLGGVGIAASVVALIFGGVIVVGFVWLMIAIEFFGFP
jgi:hypothetical protein